MRNTIIFCLIIILICTTSCKKEAESSYPNDRGELLADLEQAAPPFSFSMLLGWSRDGSEIYYLASVTRVTGPSPIFNAVYAFHLTRRTVRLVAQDTRWLGVPLQRSGQLGQSADGQRLYLMAGSYSDNDFRLYRIVPGEVTVLDSARGNFARQPTVSADGTLLGFAYRPDSIRLHQLSANTAMQISGSSVEAISPDGKQVLVRSAGFNRQPEVVMTADGSRHLVNMGVYPANQGGAITLTPGWWGPAGLSLLYSLLETNGNNVNINCYLRDIERQTSVLLWTGRTSERIINSEATLSPDGRRAAFWAYNYLAPRPQERTSTLYILNLEQQRTDTLATLTPTTDAEGNGHPSWILFSHDHTRLVYNFGSKIYLKSIQ